MRISPILGLLLLPVTLCLPACHLHLDEHHHEQHKITVTSPMSKSVVLTQPYVCQIQARRHTEIRAFDEGYLEEIDVKEGQAVKKGDVLFKIFPPLYVAKLEAEKAEVQLAKIKLANTEKLAAENVVSVQDVKLHQAELGKAQAKLQLAEAELAFATIRAPFDGIIDRQNQMQGSLIKEKEILTTLCDNSTMWVYFNVPEARYLDYMSDPGTKVKGPQIELADSTIELRLANGKEFKQNPGSYVTIEGMFNNETGNIAFRSDFPNPNGLLRHGQTGTVLIHRTMKNAIVIPQRATFEILDKQYVWVVGDDNVVHQRHITVAHELEDIYVVKSGLELKDKIVLEGVQQVHEGDKVEYDFQKPGVALANPKYSAE